MRGEAGGARGKAGRASASYPAISAAYWLPPSNPTPYHVPERKLFVGMLNKKLSENDVRSLFAGHGAIEECTVLRDAQGQSKGCAFVTFVSKQAAIAAIKVVGHDAIEVYGSEGRTGPEQGVHVRHLRLQASGHCGDQGIIKIFLYQLTASFINQSPSKDRSWPTAPSKCTVLRDAQGQSKGCTFVTVVSKQAAIAAIKALHHSQTMEGCSAPLVVKFADTQKEKEQKKLQAMQASLWGLTTPVAPATAYLASEAALSPATQLQLLQQLQAVGLQQQLLQGQGSTLLQGVNYQDIGFNGAGLSSGATDQLGGLLAPVSVQNLAALAAITQQPPVVTQPATMAPAAQPQPAPQLWSTPEPLGSAYAAQFGGGFAAAPLGSVLGSAAAAAAGKQVEGPEGGNLFIYHLPQEFTDTDLASTFLPFGHVISAKVFIDKQTNLSKCFGFVSYDNAASAQAAIQAMNGFQIGTKRLKVQLKRSKELSRPY
ncbi:unnamed protein product [Chilo suppressalis]|uniref:RRM domain-containing protein n=1 Tax=Chilo suppressalis TaxID=168631 RepID=A0ABN8LCB2_CHISP|nr:unnamed protein product [Chilo suppressalis]